MEKIILEDINKMIIETIRQKQKCSIRGKVLKVYNQEYLRNLLREGYDLGRKIVSAAPIPNVPEIIAPVKAVYTKTNLFT